MIRNHGIVLTVVLGVVLLLLLLGSAILKRTTHQYGTIYDEIKRIKAYHLLEGTAVEILYRQNQEDANYLTDTSGNAYLQDDSWHNFGNYNDTFYSITAAPDDYPRDAGDPLPADTYSNTISLRYSTQEVRVHAR